MRFLKGVVVALLVAASPLYAQLAEIKVDNSSIPGEDVASITIQQDGRVIVTSVAGVEYEIVEKVGVPGDVIINSFTLNGLTTADLAVGSSATVRWGTSNASTCTASTVPAGALSDWNSSVALTGPLLVTFPTAGVYNLKLDCSGDNGSLDSKVVTANVGSASITSFSVSPDFADIGSDVTVTLTWSSQNATLGCSGSANWPNSDALPAAGSRAVSIVNIQQDTEFELTCFGPFDEDADRVSVIVKDVKEPVETCDVTLTSSLVRDWGTVFKTLWPGPASGQMRVGVPTYGYYAVRFTTGDDAQVDAGLLSNIEASGTHGGRLGALSEIAGCFDVADECKYYWGRTGGIIWDTEATPGRCKVKPNTTYYWNMTFTDGVNPGTSTCVGSACETYLQAVNPE